MIISPKTVWQAETVGHGDPCVMADDIEAAINCLILDLKISPEKIGAIRLLVVVEAEA